VFDAARADTKKPFSNDQLDEAVASLREFAARRPQQVLTGVARIRQGS